MATRAFIVALAVVHALVDASTHDHHVISVEYNHKNYTLIDETHKQPVLNKSVFAASSNKDLYIKSELRYGLCKEIYGQVLGRTFERKFSVECFGDHGHWIIPENPCYVVCYDKSETMNDRIPEHCYSYQDGTKYMLNDFTACGENHFCDSDGFCVEKPAKNEPHPSIDGSQSANSTTTTYTPSTVTATVTATVTTTVTTIEKPQEDPATPTANETSTASPETVQPIITDTPKTIDEPVSHIPREKHDCLTSGYFADKTNPRLYYFCKYFATIHECAADEKFDTSFNTCVYDQNTEDPALELTKWKDAIHCTTRGTFLSPYNCKYFYECVPHEGEFNVYLGYCFGDLIFNETSQQCDYKKHRCNNVLVLPDPHNEQ